MKSNKSKVLQTLAGKCLIEHVIETVNKLNADNIIIIHGHLGEQLKEELSQYKITWVEQKERLGTGHAVQQAIPLIKDDNKVLILYGDVPLISYGTLNHFVDITQKESLGILTANVENPTGLGRIIRSRYHDVEKIVEEKDATDLEKQIKEINTGIYCTYGENLKIWLPKLKNNNKQKEFYLTDIVELANKERKLIKVAQPSDNFEILGVNSRSELAKLERMWSKFKVEKIMDNGVSVADPNRIDIRGNVSIGKDSWVDINTIFKGNVKIGENCIIGANTVIENSIIKDNVHIKENSVIEGSFIHESATVGPFARLRTGTVLYEKSAIGNFVEIKNSIVGRNSKAGHLTYLGDSEVGHNCNIGAGVITCNYDGANKYRTIIEDNVFIGSDSQLIAPLRVEKGATIGAGSTITKDTPANKLTLSRSPQKTFGNWVRPKKNK